VLGALIADVAPATELRKISLTELRPTQFSYGAYEVDLKRRKLDRLAVENGGLGGYKRRHPGLVVLGPGGRPYLVDGHHLARALFERGSKSMFVEVIADWSHLDEDRFGASMVAAGYCYLRDRGVRRPWEQLPESIAQMTDDPHRTLAWLVRERGAYRRLDVPYQEFAWAEFFRERLAIPALPDWEALVERGVALAGSEAARALPGAWRTEEDRGEDVCAAALVPR
jgi:hypothetical protein